MQKRVSNRLFLNLAYTWAKSIDDNSDVLGVLVNDMSSQQNPLDNRNKRGPSQFDLRHTLVIRHDYTPPFFENSSNRILKQVLGGWSFAGISSYHSGAPVNIFAGPRDNLTDSSRALAERLATGRMLPVPSPTSTRNRPARPAIRPALALPAV